MEIIRRQDYNDKNIVGGKRQMKNHRFWAWAMVACLFMTLYTGYKHK
ncbi:hypothetical protein [Faecalimonas umbilicata]|jgi:hypothetical protein|nr:hypothetical protein [Faecalimonas umbilicata]MDY5092325.1 hypothetical protein [Faecalimonas umbilicata]